MGNKGRLIPQKWRKALNCAESFSIGEMTEKSIVFFPKVGRCNAGYFLEDFKEIAGIGIARQQGDFGHAVICLIQELHCLLDAYLMQVIRKLQTGMPLKYAPKIVGIVVHNF